MSSLFNGAGVTEGGKDELRLQKPRYVLIIMYKLIAIIISLFRFAERIPSRIATPGASYVAEELEIGREIFPPSQLAKSDIADILSLIGEMGCGDLIFWGHALINLRALLGKLNVDGRLSFTCGDE